MNILVFGGHGTIGKPLVKLLQENHEVFAPTSEHIDLIDNEKCIYYSRATSLFRDPKYDCIINLAAVKTNISLNKTNPVDIYEKTVKMGMNVFDIARHNKIPRIIQCVCSCSYAPTKLLKESEFDKGPPDCSIEPHAHAKRQLYYMARFYKQQHGLTTTTLCFNNVYGYLDTCGMTLPYKYNTDGKLLKVLDALFVKMVTAKGYNKESVEMFGSGKPRREFIYYEDVARAMVEIVNVLKEIPEELSFRLLNIGIQEDISIAKLAQLLKKAVGYGGKLTFDTTKPDGQMKKLLDSSRFKSIFPNFKFTTLEEGIEKMIKEYT